MSVVVSDVEIVVSPPPAGEVVVTCPAMETVVVVGG